MCANVTEITLQEITGVFTIIGFLAHGNIAPMGLSLIYIYVYIYIYIIHCQIKNSFYRPMNRCEG
jgi:hypothetical protein